MDEMEVRARLTATDEASPVILGAIANMKKMQATMNRLGAAPPMLAGFDAAAVEHVQAMARAVNDLAAARGKDRAAAARPSRAQSVVAEMRAGLTGSRFARGMERDRQRAEGDVFRAWRIREGIRRRSTAVEERERVKAESAVMRRYRQSAAIRTRTLAVEERQRQATARASDRDARTAFNAFQAHARAKTRQWRMGEAERERQEAAERRAARTADRLRTRNRGDTRRGFDRLAGTPGRVASRLDGIALSGVVSAVTGGAAVTGLRSILQREADADSAEINMRIASGMGARQARELRNGWAMPKAVELGISPSEAMRGYTEATKVGIPDGSAKEFVELSQRLAASFEMPVDRINEILGTINAQQGGRGDMKAIGGVANAMTYLADKLATTPDKLVSFLQRGAGGATALGMRQDMGLAFGAAATSLGIQAGSAGRLLDFVAGRVISLPKIAARRGTEGNQARETVRDLGYGNAAGMDRARRANPDEFVTDLLGRFAKIKNPKKKEQALRFFAGQEWFGELSSMVSRMDVVKQSRDLAVEARKLDALGRRWELHRTKLAFVWKQMSAGTTNILGSLGEEIAPLAREAGDFFVKWSADITNGNAHVAFKRGLEGVVEGLLGRPGSLSDLMTSAFGGPGQRGQFDAEAAFAGARGFVSGLRSVFDAVKATFTTMAGALGFDTSSIESMSKFAGEFLALTVALRVARPVFGVLGLAAEGVAAVAAAMKTLTAMEAAGTISASAAGLLRFAGSLGGIAVAVEALLDLGILNRLHLPKDTSKGELDQFMWGKNKDGTSARPAWVDRLTGGDAKPGDGFVRGPHGGVMPAPNPMFQPQAYHGAERQNWRDLMTPAAFHTGGSDDIRAAWRTSEPLEAMGRDLRALRMTVEGNGVTGLRSGSTLASLGGVGGGGVGGSFTPAGPGGNQPTGAVNAFGLGRRGIMGGGSDAGGVASSLGGGVGDRANRGMSKLMSMGWSREAAAAAIGNAQQESGVRSDGPLGDTKRFGFGDDAAHGMFQWRGQRFRDLKAFAQAKGTGWQDFNTQLEFFDKESGKYGSAEWKTSKDVAHANRGMRRFEGYGDDSLGTRLANARQLMTGGAGIVPTIPASVAGAAGPSAAVDNAMRLQGAGSRQAAAALGSKMTDGQWCADFVNGALGSAGVKGSGSSMAQSFRKWGVGVQPNDVRKGDVIVEDHGRGKGHAGMATGNVQRDAAGNVVAMEMVSGNFSRMVKRNWEKVGEIAALRRSADAVVADNAAKAEGVKALGAPPSAEKRAKLATDDVASGVPVSRTTGAEIAAGVPTAPAGSKAGDVQGGGGGRFNGLGGQSSAPTAPGNAPVAIHVHGGSSDPEAIANKVHKRLSQTMNWRTHEVEMDV